MRVAVYAAPGTGTTDPVAVRLRERAESWLGRSVAGDPVDPAVPDGWSREAVDAITVDARRYGFHGTLKAPIRLADGHDLAGFDDAVAAFAASHDAIAVPRLTLARVGRFTALVPGGPAPALRALADDVVTAFEAFRAPATAAEVARRNPAGLTERERELLERYGYPYVLDTFRFHLTLTDRIPQEDHDAVEAVLRHWFADALDRDVPVDALAVFTEAEPGAPFVLHAVHRLRAAAPAGDTIRTGSSIRPGVRTPSTPSTLTPTPTRGGTR